MKMSKEFGVHENVIVQHEYMRMSLFNTSSVGVEEVERLIFCICFVYQRCFSAFRYVN